MPIWLPAECVLTRDGKNPRFLGVNHKLEVHSLLLYQRTAAIDVVLLRAGVDNAGLLFRQKANGVFITVVTLLIPGAVRGGRRELWTRVKAMLEGDIALEQLSIGPEGNDVFVYGEDAIEANEAGVLDGEVGVHAEHATDGAGVVDSSSDDEDDEDANALLAALNDDAQSPLDSGYSSSDSNDSGDDYDPGIHQGGRVGDGSVGGAGGAAAATSGGDGGGDLDGSPRVIGRRRRQPQLAMLAPLPDKAATFLQRFIYTRAGVHPSKGLSFGTCLYCTPWLWHRHFFAPPWPDDGLGYWHTIGGNHAHGLRGDGLLFAAPTHHNLFWLSTVRRWDVLVSGVCVRRRPDGLLGNTRYQVLALSGNHGGISTQSVSAKPHPDFAHRHVLANANHVRDLVGALFRSGWDMDWRRDKLSPLPLTDCTIGSHFPYDTKECKMVLTLHRKKPNPESWERCHQKAVLHPGPEGWTQPRVLPRTPSVGITMALHALLALPSVKRMLSRLSSWVEGPAVETHVTVDTLCTICGGLLRGKRATTKSFNVLRQDLVFRECLSRLACMEAPLVFQVLVDRLVTKLIAVGVDGFDAFLCQYTTDAGWIPPRGSLEMAVRYVLTAPVQDNILRHLDDVSNEARVQLTGQLLCVHVDGGLVAGPVTLDLLVRLLGRYRLPCVLIQCG